MFLPVAEQLGTICEMTDHTTQQSDSNPQSNETTNVFCPITDENINPNNPPHDASTPVLNPSTHTNTANLSDTSSTTSDQPIDSTFSTRTH
jgi:hypothetical protein